MYARLPQYIRKENKAKSDIAAMLRKCEKTYVALSWGKQSIICAHMAYNVSKDILCVHWTGPDAQLIADFDNTRDLFLNRWPVKYIELSEGHEGKLMAAIKEFVSNHKMEGVILGLAKCESKGRRHTLRKNDKQNIYTYASGVCQYRCCPLADWTNEDLAAYISKHNIPLLSTYRRYGLDVRTSVGVTPGSHAEQGIDLLSSENASKIRNRFKQMEKEKNHDI